jgi:HAD superfamily phosphatase (TIGR01668 family)
MSAGVKARGLRPDFVFSRAEDIGLEWLGRRNFRGVLIDIDNTITRWELQAVPDGELAWLNRLRDAGIGMRFLSNGLPHKLAAVIQQTGMVHVVGRPMKPLPHAFRRGLRELDLPAEQVLMIGDSVFTDIWGANRCGLWTCLVDPLSPVDFIGSKFWRFLEGALGARQPVQPDGDCRRVALAAESAGDIALD